MENNRFNPDIRLEHGERAQLAAMASTEGYRIMHRLYRSEVDKFILNLINADPANGKEVWAAHVLAKAAAQFYAAVTNRVNEEVYQYTAAPRSSDEPIDITEGNLDIGELASTYGDMLNEESLGEGILDG